MSDTQTPGTAKGVSLVNINVDLKSSSKAVIKLIDAISRGLGLLYEPVHMKRIAEASRSAMETLRSSPDALSLFDRSMGRFIAQEIRTQKNMESIANRALKELPATVDEKAAAPDWVASFFEMCKTVSDEQMQSLWARLLASEVAAPGTYSLRTLQVVKMLTKEEAEAFTLFCCYVCKDTEGYGRKVQNKKADEFLQKKVGLHWGYGEHLTELGLVRSGMLYTLPIDDSTRITTADLIYFDKSITLTKDQSQFPLPYRFGTEPLTTIGNELFSICGAKPDYEYFQVLIEALKEQGFKEE